MKISIIKLALMSGMFYVTTFMALNTVEILLEYDIPYVDAIKTIQAESILQDLTIRSSKTSAQIQGLPLLVRLPAQGIRLEIIQGSITANGWLTRTNKAHYLVAQVENQEALIIYAQKDWRTISNPNIIAVSDNLYIDTAEWRYLYRITQTYTISSQSSYVIPQNGFPQLLIIVEDTNTNTLYLFQCEYLDVQPII